MSIDKKEIMVHNVDERRIPQPYCNTVEGFFFSFIVAKHPLGYLSPW
jgi:hypothetical protein